MFKMFSTMTLLGLATISAAYAQSSRLIRAEIPFAFTVQHTQLAAGSYQFTYMNNYVLFIRGVRHNVKSVFVTVLPSSASESSNGSARLVFRCYGKTCHLAQVWQGPAGGDGFLEVLPAERQRSLALSARVVATRTIAIK